MEPTADRARGLALDRDREIRQEIGVPSALGALGARHNLNLSCNGFPLVRPIVEGSRAAQRGEGGQGKSLRGCQCGACDKKIFHLCVSSHEGAVSIWPAELAWSLCACNGHA